MLQKCKACLSTKRLAKCFLTSLIIAFSYYLLKDFNKYIHGSLVLLPCCILVGAIQIIKPDNILSVNQRFGWIITSGISIFLNLIFAPLLVMTYLFDKSSVYLPIDLFKLVLICVLSGTLIGCLDSMVQHI
jgi:hypothetical protein